MAPVPDLQYLPVFFKLEFWDFKLILKMEHADQSESPPAASLGNFRLPGTGFLESLFLVEISSVYESLK